MLSDNAVAWILASLPFIWLLSSSGFWYARSYSKNMELADEILDTLIESSRLGETFLDEGMEKLVAIHRDLVKRKNYKVMDMVLMKICTYHGALTPEYVEAWMRSCFRFKQELKAWNVALTSVRVFYGKSVTDEYFSGLTHNEMRPVK